MIIIASVMSVIVVRGALSATTNLSKHDSNLAYHNIMAFTHGCAEEGMIQMNRDNDYTGGTYNLTQGDCVIAVSGSGNTRTITASGTIDDTNYEVEVDVTLVPFVITNWDE